MYEDLGYADVEQFKETLAMLMNYLAFNNGKNGIIGFDTEELDAFCKKDWKSSMKFVRDIEEGKVYLLYRVEELEPGELENFTSEPE
jgi:hypothetical protein